MTVEAAILELKETQRNGATKQFILICHVVFSVIGMVLYVLVRLVLGPIAGLPPESRNAAPPAPAQASGNTVTIGALDGPAAPESRKTYLSTADIAARENITERTVVKYISEGRLDPPPVKDGKAYRIAAEYRILPQSAE